MDSQKTQVVERLKQANNILVTVSSNPSVDQLSACIGLTLALNKLGKHATAVFSGKVPSTIEFLQPEKTLEKNTDSLQDFIIALDKSKADKLRYKVEDRVVKIFITPYRTSISQKDLEFSQGDFNVDVVVTLGVHQQADLDQAITAHGRILHDATVMSMNIATGPELGSINWVDPNVSSLSELGVVLVDALDQKLIDGQIATSFLTGIVAETDRFSNQKTSPQTMSISAQLMSSGANQQLVATKLEEPAPTPPPAAPSKPLAETEGKPETKPLEGAPNKPEEKPEPKKDDGTIEISHDEDKPKESKPKEEPTPVPPPPAPTAAPKPLPPLPPLEEKEEEPQAPQIHIDEHGQMRPLDILPPEKPLPEIKKEDSSRMMTEPPTFETPPLTANAAPEPEDKPTDPLALPEVGLLNREPLPSQQSKEPKTPPMTPAPSMPLPSAPVGSSSGFNPSSTFGAPTPANPGSTPPSWNTPPASSLPGPGITPVNPSQPTPPNKTLSQIEEDVHSPHLNTPVGPTPPTPAPTPMGSASASAFDGPAFGAPASPGLAPAPMNALPNDMLPPNPPSANGIVTPNNGPIPSPASPPTPTLGASTPPSNDPGMSVNAARDAVAQAINGNPNSSLEPIQALNAQPMTLDPLHGADSAQPQAGSISVPQPQPPMPLNPGNAGIRPAPGAPAAFTPPVPSGQPLPGNPTPAGPSGPNNQAPPAVPPPMMPMPPSFPQQ